MTIQPSSVFEPSSDTPPRFLSTGDINMTVNSHHEILIRLDERLKTFATREDLSRISIDAQRECQALVKWCMGTIVVAVITLLVAAFGTWVKETPVKLFVVSETQLRSSAGAQAFGGPKDALEIPQHK